MTPEDFILGIVCTSGVIGMGIGLVIGMIGQARFGCETCHQRAQSAAIEQQSLEAQGYRAFPDRPRIQP